MAGEMVSVSCVVVPDGIVDGKLRLSLGMAPSPIGSAHVDLDDWPRQIHQLAKQIKVRVGTGDQPWSTNVQVVGTYPSDLDQYTSSSPPSYDLDAATLCWRKIKAGLSLEKWKTAFAAPRPRTEAPKLAYSASTLARHLDEMHAEQTRVAAAEIAAGLDGSDLSHFGELPPKPDSHFWVSLHRLVSEQQPRRDFHAERLKEYSRSSTSSWLSFADAAKSFRVFYEEQHREKVAAAAAAGPGGAPTHRPALVPDEVLTRLAGISAYPTLAKFLGMIVDVCVPLSDLPVALHTDASAFAIQVTFDNDTINSTWTACRYSPKRQVAKQTIPAFFGPAPADDSVFKDGLLDLRAKPKSGAASRRFSLSTIDPGFSTLLLCMQAEARDQADKGGAARDTCGTGSNPPVTENDLTPPRTNGLAFFDSDGLPVKSQSRPTIPEKTLFHLEDLLYGYRIDAALGDSAVSERWRPMVARQLVYKSEIPAEFLALSEVVCVRSRDDGHVRPMLVKDGNSYREQIFVWSGESLGLPVPPPDAVVADGAATLVQEKPNPIPVSIDFCLPEGDRKPLPLREGRGYTFGARLFLANGCSIRFEDAVKRYVVADTSLGLSLPPVLGEPSDNGDAPYVYRRYERIRAPELLLTTNEKLIRAKKPELDTPGETVEKLVIRLDAPDYNQRTTMRALLPPAVAFEMMEQHGSFDALPSATKAPVGLFEGTLKVKMESNGFPLAHDGHWDNNPTGDPSKHIPSKSRGAVLALNVDDKMPDPPYYPDPMARALRVAFKGSNAGIEVDFWEKGDFTQASPIILQLSPASGTEPTLTKDTIQIDDEKQKKVGPFTRINVQLPPGRSVELDIWPQPDPDDHAPRHQVMHRLKKDVPKVDLKSLMNAAPLAPCVGRKTVTLTHAVQQPFKVPASVSKMSPVVIPEKSHNECEPAKAWADYVTDQKSTPVSDWKSVGGGNTTYFAGPLGVNGASTGRLRCEARWKEYSKDTVRKTEAGWIDGASQVHHRLFSVDDIPESGTSLDLLYHTDRSKGLRAIGYSFVNGAGRILTLRTIATSRFTDCYPPDSDAHEDGIGKYETELISFADKVVIKVPCVFQPPKPEIDKIVPVFHWQPQKSLPRRIESARTISTRVYLKRPWNVSGEAEMVALLFADPSDPVDSTLDGLVTRWGADVLHQAGAVLNEYVPPTAVSGKGVELLKDKVFLKIADAPNGKGGYSVYVVSALPSVDSDTGLWYFDFDLDTKGVYAPFVELAIGRYQANAVETLKLSRPQLAWTQILPSRSIEIANVKGGAQVTYSGLAFTKGAADSGNVHPSQMPLVSMRLMHKAMPEAPDKATPWLPLRDAQRAEVSINRATGIATWTAKLSGTFPLGECGVLIEEFETLPADSGTLGQIVPRDRAPFFARVFDLSSFTSRSNGLPH